MLNKRNRTRSGSDLEKVSAKKQKVEVVEEEEDDFKMFGIDDSIKKKLNDKSILSLFEVQKKVFKPIYKGKNVVVASLTGSGKTLSFVLPLIQKYKNEEMFNQTKPVILVIAPTRELSIQVGREFSELSNEHLKYKVVMVYGGVSIEDQIYKLRAGCDIIVGTPGRIIDMIDRGDLYLKRVQTVVLDEADKMLSMGFTEQIDEIFKKIYETKKEEDKVQVCLFSATIERWVMDVATKIMKGHKHEFIDLVKNLEGRTPKTVQHLAVKGMKHDRVMTIADLILCYGGKNKATIVFVNTKRECSELMLSDKIKQEVQIVHGDINQKQREVTIEGFKKGKFKCLIATDVASRGLDIPMVDLVIQSEPPKEIDSYIHRAGRTARAGRTGTCITLYTKMTEGLITRIEQKAKIKFKKIGAPQRSELIEASNRDIKFALNNIDEGVAAMFTKSAQALIEEFGAENSIARLFAYVSGHTEKMKSRSVICGAEGWVTYIVKCTAKFNHVGYMWSLFKRIIPEEIKNKIRGLKPFKNMDGCVFDFPEEGHKDFENIIFNDKLHGTSYTLSQTDTLPELVDEEPIAYVGPSYGNHRGNNSGGGSYGNGNRSSGGNRREGRLDIFMGNLPFDANDGSIKQWIEKNGVTASDIEVRMVMDKETGTQKGFAFASTYDKSVLDKIVALNGKMFNSRALRINEAAQR